MVINFIDKEFEKYRFIIDSDSWKAILLNKYALN